MCGFVRVSGIGGMGGFLDGNQAPFQHHRDVVAGPFLEVGLGEVEVGAGIVRFPCGQSGLFLCACGSGLDALFRHYPGAVLADSDSIGDKYAPGVLGYGLDSSNHTSFKWNFWKINIYFLP